jgi:competence protein ComEA
VVTAALLVLALGLLGWHVLAAQRWMARPTTAEAEAAPAFRVDLNRADRAELLQLPGVGDSLAGRILEYRQANGGFRSVEDLRHVRGVGPAVLERLRPYIYAPQTEPDDELEPEPTVPAPPPVRLAARERKPAVAAAAVGRKAVALRGPVDVNAASAEELQRLPGVGPKTVARILQARGERPFRSVEDLRRVPGIGPKSLERLRPHVTVTSDARPAAP